jgi:hypothetical protein
VTTSASESSSGAQRHGASTSHDQEIWQRIETVVDRAGHSLTDVLESFPV